MDQQKSTIFRSGFVTLVGKPNAGKSTLLNALVGEKIAIVSPRPQTTRTRIMGIANGDDWQIVFLDTPGIHDPRTKLGEYMMQSVTNAMDGMDALVVMTDAAHFQDQDRRIAEQMSERKCPKVLVLNKIDVIPHEKLLNEMAALSHCTYDAIIPVSAKTGDGLRELTETIIRLLPQGPKYFPDDMVTDQPERLICAELIREKALAHLRDEVPHGIGVEMMAITKESEDYTEMHATIYCEREAHKGMIIGKQGSMLKIIGSEAREDIERLMNTHVNLKLWVKVRPDWRNKTNDLRDLGYDNR